MKYSMKVHLEQLLHEQGASSEFLVFKDSYFLERTNLLWKTSVFKSLLSFVTFVNCEGAYLVERFLRNLCSYFDVALGQS